MSTLKTINTFFTETRSHQTLTRHSQLPGGLGPRNTTPAPPRELPPLPTVPAPTPLPIPATAPMFPVQQLPTQVHKPQAVSTSTPQHAWTFFFFFDRSFYRWSFERYWEVDDISAFLGGFLVPYPSKRTQHLLSVSVLSKPSLIQFAQSKLARLSPSSLRLEETCTKHGGPLSLRTWKKQRPEGHGSRRLRFYCGPLTYSFGTICRRWRTSLIEFYVLLCRGRLSILWGTQPSLF